MKYGLFGYIWTRSFWCLIFLTSEFKISYSIERKLWWKNDWKLPKLLRFQKMHSFKTTFEILIAQIKNFNKDCVKISSLYLICFPKNKPSKSVTAEPGWVGWGFDRFSLSLNDPKNVFQIFPILFEGFKYRQSDPYIIANKNFVCFAHS